MNKGSCRPGVGRFAGGLLTGDGIIYAGNSRTV